SAIGLAMTVLALALLPAPSVRAQGETPVNGVVAVLTDFGNNDFMAGALSGAVLSANPGARLVPISQEIPPFSVREGAFWLQQAARRFPRSTVFLAIVDPTIATAASRKLVVETNDGKIFVGPDNGLLSLALADSGVRRAYALTRAELMAPGALSQPPSLGRDVYDIFGSAAGRLAAGAPASAAGAEVQDWVRLTVQPGRLDGEALKG